MRAANENKQSFTVSEYREVITKKAKENKKVKNATVCTYNNITFKSELELYCYKLLVSLKLPVEYEKRTYTIFPKNKLTTTNAFIYGVKTKSNLFAKRKSLKTLQPISYTPDFVIETTSHIYIVETKGKSNDAYPLRRKMFLSFMEQSSPKPVIFLEPHTKKGVNECISNIIQHLNYVNKTTNVNKKRTF